ncbi:sigma-54 dependent transcriptional regulator [Ponticaulis sp.]|uniref:sigma-54-dependent transcriptional regulator n=1 Tax=Ponticaulis sp. TaxID=2020902 RepID=UPI000B7326BD|nr:sigma-54 dependent transcriptional regulator [Ponticaulis sp.]MAI89817.1 sigma-54-dependent Fis family transcriptional regulator [Ponticaulis sp.]OUX99493.1 MAG: sigma-54-dependent Fis family transcriptional regulator [Hyphomonadaceae bacterium TMED5]|tara:strand:+ start:50639 stop:52126 length:1488 start_codon:yes stop_codon:yes gene_type:complete
MAKTVLVVDDDPTQRRLLQAAVERAGFACRVAPDGESGLDMARNPSDGVDVMLLDLVMPGLSGMDVLERLQEVRPDLPVMVLTASGSIDTVVQAMRAGAIDFFVKPASPERVVVSIRNALQMTELRGEVKRLKKTASGELSFDDMIASAPAMRQVVRLGQRAASSNIPILILGESGVGKEVIARCIQGASERAGRPFVTVNCGAIPENLVESILFGHEKGAFTGAVSKSPGKFVEADGGTLFLDEVGELPLEMQVKLLRALQEGEVDAVGSRRPTKVDVRIISATNKDLSQLVGEGRFREDLYYRLNVFPVDMPSLRERKDDIPALVQHFIRRFNASEGTKVSGASASTMALLNAYDWPGNVRQLENMIFRAVVLCEGDELKPEDFPQLASLAEELPDMDIGESGSSDLALTSASLQALQSDEMFDHPVRVTDTAGELRALEEVERDLIQYAIDFYAGHMSEVARKLGIGRSTLYRKVREHDLRVKPEEDEAQAG